MAECLVIHVALIYQLSEANIPQNNCMTIVWGNLCKRFLSFYQVRYIILLFLSFPLAFILRHLLHPSRTPLTVRYVYSLALGLYFGCSCFGMQMLILFGIVGVSYLMLIFLPPTVVQRSVTGVLIECYTSLQSRCMCACTFSTYASS